MAVEGRGRRPGLRGWLALVCGARVVFAADTTPPQVSGTVPATGAVVRELTFAQVVFTENVTGVDAADLLVNGVAARSVEMWSPRDYTFSFPAPAAGTVRFRWAANHGIRDLATPANAFAGTGWDCTLDTAPYTANVILSEFLADNEHGLRDNFGDRSDWIELRNLTAQPVPLDGWHLSDDASRPTKWRFPAVTLPASGHLLVWASERNLASPLAPLHTNFKLGAGGEYLGLRDPQGTAVSEYAPAYPPQYADVSYGRATDAPGTSGYFPTPTPGGPNSTSGPGFAPAVTFSMAGGVFTNATLRLELSAPSGVIRYTTDGTVPTEASTRYSAPITLVRSTVVFARVFQPGLLPGPAEAQAYELLGVGTAAFSSNLPLLILNTSSRGVSSDTRTTAYLTVIEPWRGRAGLLSKPQFQGRAQIEHRGQSSLMFPKKAYNLELNDAAGLDLEAPLLDLPAESDWVLYNPYSDKPFLQNFLAYELHAQMGHYAPRCRFVELFVDASGGKLDYGQDYQGVYLLVEKLKVDGNRVDLERLTPTMNAEPEITGGYMIKKDKDSPGDRGFSTVGGAGHPGQYLKYHEPKPREITPAQETWIRNYLLEFEKALYASNWLTRTGTNHYGHYIDVDSFVDNHWIVEFAKQIDGYRLSNYLHKDRGGKLKMDPIWDWNLSFGNADYLDGANPRGWYYPLIDANAHIWLRRLICGTTSGHGTAGDPDFNQRIADRWSELRTNVLAASNILARVDEMAAYLDEAATRDFARWPRLGTYIWPNPPLYSQPTTYAGIIANMKTWIASRSQWIDSQFLLAPTLDPPGGSLSPGVTVTIPPASGPVYFTTDGSDPRAPGGGVSGAARLYSGPVPLDDTARVTARVRSGTRWSGPTAATLVVDLPRLAVTELLFQPAAPPAGSTNDPGDFEFLEFRNTGTVPLDLRGFRITDGVQFSFATGAVTVLQPDARVVVVRNARAFQSRYGTVAGVAGTFDGALANAGERLRVTGPAGETVVDLTYDPAGHPATEGHGFALVPVDESAGQAGGEAVAWRTGSVPDGTPGQPEPPAPLRPAVVVNEVAAHNDPPLSDFIELHNPDPTPADISGWFLTDDRRTPKYRVPAGTILPPGGFAVFTEAHFNPQPGIPPSFGLGATGDEVYLLSADAAGRLTGYVQGTDFEGSLPGEALGRHVTSDGRVHFLRQSTRSPGAPNPGPAIGPMVITEVHYHPPDVFTNAAWWDNTEHEFIELHNPGPAAVPLYEPTSPTHTWRLRDAVSYTLPTNTLLAAGERVLVVGFDPAAEPALAASFRSLFNPPAGTRLFGPWNGKLSNAGGSVELVRPHAADSVVSTVLIDRVRYRDAAPWPAAADGTGLSLQRLSATAFGSEPTNWMAAAASAGRAAPATTPPVITLQPQGGLVDPGTRVTLRVAATAPGTLYYQWRRDGTALPGATAHTLELPSAQPADSGTYEVLVWTAASGTVSSPAVLEVAAPPRLLAGPQGGEVRAGTPVNLTVQAVGQRPLQYLWRRDGLPVPGGTRPALAFTASPADAGSYDVVVTDGPASVTSAPARLSVVVDPVIIAQPLSQTAGRGGSVTFSVAVTNSASLPIRYLWRKNGVLIANRALAAHVDFLTLTGLQPADAGAYSVAVVNGTLPSAGLTSDLAHLGIVELTDSDGDGLPDDFERAHGLDPLAPSDAALDRDGDGMSALDEYRAGTDPGDPLSVLRITRVEATGAVSIRFLLPANRTATVLRRATATSGTWTPVGGIPATSADSPTLREVEVRDAEPPGSAHRFYRLVVPGVSGP